MTTLAALEARTDRLGDGAAPPLPLGRVWRPPVSAFAALAAWLALTGYSLWQAVGYGTMQWTDSIDYETIGRGPLTGAALWAGVRPPVVPLVWSFMPSAAYFVVIQTVASMLAWGFLAWTVRRLAGGGWRGTAAAAAVLLFACSGPVVEWDRAVLSESISISALVALLASGVWLVRRFTWWRAAAVVVEAVVFAGARDADIVPVVIAGLGALVLGVRRFRRGRPEANGLFAMAVALVAVGALALTGEMVASRDAINLENALAVRVFPYPDRVAWFSSHGMPEGARIDRLAAAEDLTAKPGTAPVVWVDTVGPDAALGRWLGSGATGTYAEFLLTHPSYTLSAPFQDPPLTFNDAQGQLSFYAYPGPDGIGAVTALLYPSWWWELPLIVGAAVALTRRRWWRRPEILLLAGAAALGPLVMLLAWQTDGQEVQRHMVEGAVEARVAVLALLVAAVSGRSRAATPAPAPSPVP